MGNEESASLRWMLDCGFSPEDSREALKQNNNDPQRAVEWLTNRGTATGSDPNKAIVIYDSPHTGSPAPSSQTQSATSISADAQVQKLLEETRKSATANEELELSKAIQMSLNQATTQGPQPMDVDYSTGAPKLSDEERLLNQAIEQSLQTNGGGGVGVSGDITFSTENPTTIIRVPGVPVGLKNVGNTCYVNSLLQTYFMIPSLRKAVLQFTANLPPPAPLVTGPDGVLIPQQQALKVDEDTADFMKELQRLFGYLVLTNQSYVDPSHLLKKLKDKSGNTLKIGNQEDVSEFNDLFLETIERGLNLDRKLTEAVGQEFIRRLFYGTSIQFITGKEEDGSLFEVQNNSVYNHLILRVGPELPDLFSSLDSYVCDTVEYTTERGYKTNGLRTTWFKDIPPVLMFQQSRVEFDAENKTYKKSLSPLAFDKEIFIDRYLVKNREITAEIRGKLAELRGELSKLEAQLLSYTNHKGRGHALDSGLAGVIDYLRDKQAAGSVDIEQTNSVIELLCRCHTNESNVMSDLRNKIDYLNSQISSAYNFMQAHPYTLYAVWVHQGVAGSGHYWAFLRDPRTDQWMRFNDMRTAPVTEEEVMRESVGGYANSSAYFLLYVDRSTIDYVITQDDAKSCIPEELKLAIEASNAKFMEAVAEREKKSTDVLVQRFVDNYNKKLDDISKLAADKQPYQDNRIKSLWTFMYCLQMQDLVKADVVQDMYTVEFARGITVDVDSDAYRKLSDKISKELVDAARSLAGDPSRLEPIRVEHRNFQNVAQYCVVAMTELLAKNCSACGNHLLTALRRDRELEAPVIKREEDIVFLLRICIQAELGEVLNKLALKQPHQAITHLKDAVGFVLALGTTDAIMPVLKQTLSMMASQSPEPIIKNAANIFLKFIEITGNTVRPPLPKIELPVAPTLTKDEGVQLMERYGQLYKQTTTEFFQALIGAFPSSS